MARKKSASATNQKQETHVEPKRGEKTQAIRDLFGKGVIKPLEIDAAMKKQGLSVSMPVIYTTVAKLKKGGGQKGRPKGAAVAVSAPAPSSPARRASSGGLVVEEINQLVEITAKAGGVDVVVELLQNMKRVQ